MPTIKQIPLTEIKDDLSRYLRLAENEQIVITKHGKPAGILVGFASVDDWFDYKLENDARFLQRIAKSRASPQAGKSVKLEELKRGAKPLASRTWRGILLQATPEGREEYCGFLRSVSHFRPTINVLEQLESLPPPVIMTS